MNDEEWEREEARSSHEEAVTAQVLRVVEQMRRLGHLGGYTASELDALERRANDLENFARRRRDRLAQEPRRGPRCPGLLTRHRHRTTCTEDPCRVSALSAAAHRPITRCDDLSCPLCHRARLITQGRLFSARCSCGWESRPDSSRAALRLWERHRAEAPP